MGEPISSIPSIEKDTSGNLPQIRTTTEINFDFIVKSLTGKEYMSKIPVSIINNDKILWNNYHQKIQLTYDWDSLVIIVKYMIIILSSITW